MADNPMLDAYIEAKQIETDEKIKEWVHALRAHYDAAIAEGFTEEQAFYLLDMFWTHVDDYNLKKKEQDDG